MNQVDPLSQDRLQRALGADYEILRPLGQGGMATVWLARERALKRLVAIKVLDPELGASPVFRNRFQLEAETAAQLQHPNIVPIFRVGAADGLAYYAMAFVDGESLADRMRGTGRLGVREARRIAVEVALALAAAHRRGVIHRDVKPQNVLLDRESGHAMVTDFGIASVAGAAAREGDRLTNAGMVMGTPRYMSPEQASGERDLTPASDLYALGVMLYEMLSGEYPYRLADPPNYLLAHLTGSPIPLVTRVGDVPVDLERVVNRSLQKDPRDRHASGEEVAAGLRDALEHSGSGERLPLRRGRRRWLLAGAALGAVLLGAVVARGRGGDGVPPGVDPRRSLLIGFFDNTQQRPQLDWLRVGGVDLLAQALGSWSDLTVIDAERLLDLARRRDLDTGSRLSQEDVIALARAAGVWTATVGSVAPVGDSLAFTLKVYDVASATLLTSARATAPDSGDLAGAFRELARQVLAIAGAPATLAAGEPPTRSLEAYRAYIEGIEAVSRWQLPEAMAAFRRAVAADPAFALAYFELSQASGIVDAFDPGTPYVALADSALRHAAGRPPRERALLEGYHALMHADAPLARQRLGALLAEDSLNAEAWRWYGVASQVDLTLRTDAAGREYLPADFTAALRAYQRALELDGANHGTYAQLAQLLRLASERETRLVPGYREPPVGNFSAISLRTPRRWFTPILRGDSIVLLPAESLAVRLRPAELDSLRRAARDRAGAVVRRWLVVAPDEGEAHLILAGLEYADRSYEASLRALGRADSLGAFSQMPLPMVRLAILLAARRFDEAAVVGDSIAPRGQASPELDAPLFGNMLTSYLFSRGRLAEGRTVWQRSRSEIARFDATSEMRRRLALADSLLPVAIAARAGSLTPEAYRAAEATVARSVAAAAPAERDGLRRQAARALLLGAAALGDSGAARRWREAWGTDSLPALDAAAVAATGDRARAATLYERAARDTTSDVLQLFALGVTAEALGRPQQAEAHYARLDSAEVESSNWLLAARAYARRGATAAALGDTVAARRHYDTFLALWRDADSPVQEEVAAVRRAREELDRPTAR